MQGLVRQIIKKWLPTYTACILFAMFCTVPFTCSALATHSKSTKHVHIVKTMHKPHMLVVKKTTHVKKLSHNIKAPHIQHPIVAQIHQSQTNQINTGNIIHSNLPLYVLTSIEQRLVNFVRNTVSSIRYSSYKLGGTKIDQSRGIYVVDCSSYVDHILKKVYPNAFSSLVDGTGSEKPTSDDYYDYFVNLADRPQNHWNSIEDVEQLRPGDILVFRFKNSLGVETGGHVMVVMDQPSKSNDTFAVRIADSAPAGHSEDTRLPRKSGIGIGTLLLKVDPKSYQPYAYAWRQGAHWQRNVNFAMARPVDAS